VNAIRYTLFAFLIVSLTSAIWSLGIAREREKVKQLNRIIQEQHETLHFMASKHARNWKEKNEAWAELNRQRRD
jgi:hypothetical protein